MSRLQQKRLYDAERCLWAHGREFSNIDEILYYLDSILVADWFVKRFGYLPGIKVQEATIRGGYAGGADRKSLTIYLKRRNEHVVLHELCHLLGLNDDHDEMFVDNFQFLIRNVMGFYAWAEFTFELNQSNYWEAV